MFETYVFEHVGKLPLENPLGCSTVALVFVHVVYFLQPPGIICSHPNYLLQLLDARNFVDVSKNFLDISKNVYLWSRRILDMSKNFLPDAKETTYQTVLLCGGHGGGFGGPRGGVR